MNRDTVRVQPETRYAQSGEVSIAYQIVGDGPFDLVYVPGAVFNVELTWEDPAAARYFSRLAAFSRLILFDKRGTGLSDRVMGIASLETRMDDLRAVMDAAGSQRAVVVGSSEGGPMSALFAATYPERTVGLALYGSLSRFTWAPDYPWGARRDDFLREGLESARNWGTFELAAETLRSQHPGATDEEIQWQASRNRLSASPGAIEMLTRMNADIDVRDVLPTIRVPTVVLHRTDDHLPVEGARWMAGRIPGARFVELPGKAHWPWYGDWESVIGEIESFAIAVTAEQTAADPAFDRVLTTVLFTDIVGSSERASELGDRAWRDLIERHHALVRSELTRFRGKEMDSAGDGFFATFDGPARAIQSACAIRERLRRARPRSARRTAHRRVRTDRWDKVGGIAVHIGARVRSHRTGPGEVMVSSTVKDLVAGSDLRFEDRDLRSLKGIPGRWHLFAVDRRTAAARAG